MNNESSGETTYRTSQLQRSLALASAASLLLMATLRVTGDRPLWEPSLLNFVLTAGHLLVATGYGLRARIQVSERAVRKTRPLWSDNTVRFGDVRRAHLPLTEEGLWLYTDPDGSPDLAVEAQSFERFDELACQVIRRLPSDAEVSDPADRLDGYPCGDETTARIEPEFLRGRRNEEGAQPRPVPVQERPG